MTKKHKAQKSDCLRLNPETRYCPKFDATSTAMFPVANSEDMGVRVIDDCAEEHIM